MALLQKLNILIVDDEPEIREILIDYLRQGLKGEISIIETPDGQAALQKIKNQKFNLMISDIKMPKLDGTGLFKAISTGVDAHYQPEFIMILSAHIPAEKNNKTIGRVIHLAKPVKQADFLAHLRLLFPSNAR